MNTLTKWIAIASITAALDGCGGQAQNAALTKPTDSALNTATKSVPNSASTSTETPTAAFTSDGPSSGLDAEQLIQKALGSGAHESPDKFDGLKHITETTDPTVGNVFLFTLHYPADGDPTNLSATDRQRNEIKVYDGSNDNLKGYQGTTFTYRWMFKPDRSMIISNRFTHLFQIKSNGGSEAPLITFTGENGNFILIYTDPAGHRHDLKTLSWNSVQDTWMQATVTATYSHHGALSVTLNKLDGSKLISYSSSDIDLWLNDQFCRPKWGIYRGKVPGLN
ncbi:MAG: hypothetical protein JWN30_1688, partial [Bacilli bacterium]|nr:hypothetical protein [Bacilli bacterium]